MGIKVLLDTDIGSDIDDAVCLAYLLANPACDLLGITTVTGDTSSARAWHPSSARSRARKSRSIPGDAIRL
jgi:inosine-uridine nucleoside N-ribohydrolase